MIQACIAVYPLGQQNYDAVRRALDALAAADVEVTSGTMNTVISGSEAAVFDAIRAAFAAAAERGGTVLTVTISNACPV
jgi:uncharacterized protein YqgV (UPF0045/DUF77 family)